MVMAKTKGASTGSTGGLHEYWALESGGMSDVIGESLSEFGRHTFVASSGIAGYIISEIDG